MQSITIEVKKGNPHPPSPTHPHPPNLELESENAFDGTSLIPLKITLMRENALDGKYEKALNPLTWNSSVTMRLMPVQTGMEN